MRKTKIINRTHIPKQEKVDNKVKIQDQKVLQEVLLKPNSFEEKRDKLQEELQGYYYGQSSKFSSVSRSLIFGILATIWVFIGHTVPGTLLRYDSLAELSQNSSQSKSSFQSKDAIL